jgi:hypothetical protein
MSYNPYRKFCDRWWWYWTNVPGDVWDFIVRVYDYLPFLWEDRDWDFNCTLRLVRFKLRRLKGHLERHSILAHTEDRVAELAKVDVLLRNILDEDPDDEWSQHYNQWDIGTKSWKECKNKREHYRSLRLTRRREERNWHRVWRYIDKYARGWWD